MAGGHEVGIRFFELIDQQDEERIGAVDWNQRLDRLSTQTIGLVPHGRRALDGSIYGVDGHRVLSVAVDRDMAARQRQSGTGQRKSMTTDGDDWHPSEESFAVFFERNVFGLLRISTAAPTHAAVARWLNRASPWRDNRGVPRYFKAVPVVDPDILQRIRDRGGVITSADFAFEPQSVPDDPPSLFAQLGRFVGNSYDDGVIMEVGVKAGRRRGAQANRERLDWDTMQVLEADQGHGFLRRAKGTYKPADGGPQEPFDMLGEKLAVKSEIQIPSNDPEGWALATNAAAAIRSAYSAARERLDSLVPPTV